MVRRVFNHVCRLSLPPHRSRSLRCCSAGKRQFACHGVSHLGQVLREQRGTVSAPLLVQEVLLAVLVPKRLHPQLGWRQLRSSLVYRCARAVLPSVDFTRRLRFGQSGKEPSFSSSSSVLLYVHLAYSTLLLSSGKRPNASSLKTNKYTVTWCFTPSQPIRSYQGERLKRTDGKTYTNDSFVLCVSLTE